MSIGILSLVAADKDQKLHKAGTQAEEWVRSNPTRKEASLIKEKIASVPQSIWLAGKSLDHLEREAAEARKNDATLVFTTYMIPGRDNGNYSAGGLSGPPAYHAWVREAARRIGTTKAIGILEPDAIGLALNLKDEIKKKERYQMIADSVILFKQNAHTKVFIETAHWLRPEQIAEGFKLVGGDRADGFCLNVSGFETTESCIAKGVAVSRLVGNKPFIVDTSRNGNGPWKTQEKDPWCNPPGRALGKLPTFHTGHALVYAFLWIKRPGESDGDCRGGPPAGQFHPEYAYELAKNAKP